MVEDVNDSKILYERIGGEPVCDKMSDVFVSKFKDDPNVMNLLKEKDDV